MKTSEGETFALVFAKESAVTKYDVIDLVTGALAIKPMPFLRRLLTLSEEAKKKKNKTFSFSNIYAFHMVNNPHFSCIYIYLLPS